MTTPVTHHSLYRVAQQAASDQAQALGHQSGQADERFWTEVFDQASNPMNGDAAAHRDASASGSWPTCAPMPPSHAGAGAVATVDTGPLAQAGRFLQDTASKTPLITADATQRLGQLAASHMTASITPRATAFPDAGSVVSTSDHCDLQAPLRAPTKPTPQTPPSPVMVTVASSTEGGWKIYLRAKGLTQSQALTAAAQAMGAGDSIVQPHVNAVLLNGQVIYQAHAADASVDAGSSSFSIIA